MLIYEKKVNDERHLFGTTGTVPADSDSQLTYVDENKAEVEVSLSKSYFDNGNGGIKDSDGTSIFVMLDDEVIIPAGADAPESNACDITAFSIDTAEGVIDGTNIAVEVAKGTDVTKLTPTITVSADATVSPASGEEQDFTNAVTYTVTAENGETTKEYTVSVTEAA